MCYLHHPVTSGAPGGTIPGMSDDAPDSGSMQGVSEATGTPDPNSASRSTTTMQPTKFAKLLKVVMPMVQGGLVGGFGGNWKQPGSGFAASSNFFNRQKEMALRKMQMQQNATNQSHRNALEDSQARRQDEMANNPYAAAAARTWSANVDGEDVIMRTSPTTGNPEIVGKKSAQTGTFKPDNTDQGIVPFNTKTGTASAPLTTPPTPEKQGAPLTQNIPTGNQAVDDLQSEAAKDLGEEQDEKSVSTQDSGGLPLHPYEKPQKPGRPMIEHNRDASGKETDVAVDPSTVKPGDVVGSRAPRPQKPTKASTKADPAKTETYAQAILTEAGNDVDKANTIVNGLQSMPPEMKSAVRARIREIGRKAPQQKRRLSDADRQRLSQGVPQE
jgi:hypothetical protein